MPHWREDGRELFYIDARGDLIAVPIPQSDTFEVGASKTLFSTNLPPLLTPFRETYAVTANGQRFLIESMLPDADPSTITLILDWPAAIDENLRSALPGAAPGDRREVSCSAPAE